MIMALSLIFSSCSVTRDVPDDQVLLNKVKVDIPDRNLKSSMSSLVNQKENRKILWVTRFKLRFYSSFLFKKDSQKKMRYNVGEPPVLYDSVSARNTVQQMRAYLKNRGYYQNRVSYREEIRKSNPKKMKVIYEIDPGTPTLISDVILDIHDEDVRKAIEKSMDKSLIKKGNNFDLDVLENERKRLVKHLQNNAYFFFSNDLIFYVADTIKEKNKAIITYKIKTNPVKYFGDSTKVNPYMTYKIRNVFVRQDFQRGLSKEGNNEVTDEFGYKFLNSSGFTVKPKVISRSIFHGSDEFYTLENHESTYRRLQALNNYKYVNLTYRKSADSLPRYLDCVVNLSPGKPESIGIEMNLTNTGGFQGINLTTSYVHRNIFRGAEMLRFSIYTGAEAQLTRSTITSSNVDQNNNELNNPILNTIEIGPEVSLTLPKFLLPVDQNKFAKRFIPTTTITASYNYQQRPDYKRNIINGGLIYSWKESKTKTHAIQPVNLNQVEIDPSDDFQLRLDTLDNASLRASYEDNFIASISYNFVYNNQILNKKKSYQILRANVELAGNLISLLQDNVLNLNSQVVVSGDREKTVYLINGIPYAQFFRTFVEFVPHIVINPANKFVSRTFIGVGIPYGNSFSMPFVRSFYGGGANGIRAWEARTLGPGSISNDSTEAASIDQIGDIKIEQNLEYRFRIISFLEGAAFVDMGNIWVFNNPEFDEAANFQFSNLWKDLAIGTGLGIRLNFDYFVVRLDYGTRIKDPGRRIPGTNEVDQSFLFDLSIDNSALNFAVGYPF